MHIYKGGNMSIKAKVFSIIATFIIFSFFVIVGVFAFTNDYGRANEGITFRIVLTP